MQNAQKMDSSFCSRMVSKKQQLAIVVTVIKIVEEEERSWEG